MTPKEVQEKAAALVVEMQNKPEVGQMIVLEHALREAFEEGKLAGPRRTEKEIRAAYATIKELQPWNLRDIGVLAWVLGEDPKVEAGSPS